MDNQGWEDLTGDGGVVKRVVRAAPAGAAAPSQQTPVVDLQYEGRFSDSNGSVFDSTEDDNSIFSFQINTKKVIRAWDVAVPGMRVGEVAEIICRPDYAYGDAGAPPDIPPGATLWFKLELKDARVPRGAQSSSGVPDADRLSALRKERELAAEKRELEKQKREAAKAAAAARLADKGPKKGGKSKK
eukprot:jgi/Chlat1/6746/Chrsp50S06441